MVDRKFLLYVIIGLTGAFLDFVAFLILHYVFNISPGVSSFLSVSIGIINNFFLNYFFNFKESRDNILSRLISFYSIGIFGAILSAILIVVLNSGLNINPVISKIITIAPVVLLQFILNKKISFSSTPLAIGDIWLFIKKHRYLFIILIIFITGSLFFVKKIPTNTPISAPDENIHFEKNVMFIISEHRLPVSGKDDVEVLSDCGNGDISNYVQCTYSYQSYIGANYAANAFFSWILHNLTDISYLKSARLFSTFCGILFVIFTYLTVLLITKSPAISGVITALVSLIPQVIFVFSYVNQDAHSLMIAAVVMFTLTWFTLKRSRLSIVATGVVVGGLLPLVKYNYFTIIILVGLYFLFMLIYKQLPLKTFYKTLIIGLSSFILISSFWYVRNIVLYNDLLGQGYMLSIMENYHHYGHGHDLWSLETLKTMLGMDFFPILFKSFFYVGGLMAIYLEPSVYNTIFTSLLLVLLLYVYSFHKNKINLRKLAYPLLILIGFIILNIILVYYNSVTYDFQPQGRYLYPIIPVVVIVISMLHTLNRKNLGVFYIYIFMTIYLLLSTIGVILRNYL